jgi:hypothetical protein
VGRLCKTNPIRGSKRAKRTQFGPARGRCWDKMRKTKPNLGRLGHVGKGRRVGRGAAGSETCKTNPISPARRAGCAEQTQSRPPAEGVGRACRAAALRAEATPDQVGGKLYEEPKRAKRTQFGPAGTGDGGKCAKRSQTWGDRGTWAKGAVWPWPGRGVKHAKRTQFADCGLKDVARGRPTPDQVGGRPYEEAKRAKRTQFGPRARKWAWVGLARGPAGGRLCETNPISAARGPAPEAKCARRSQLGSVKLPV